MRFLAACLGLLVLGAACGEPTGPPPPLTVRLMTFNLRWDGFDDGPNDWDKRREIAYRVFRELAPDSAGTQEGMKRQIADIEAAVPKLGSYRFDNHPTFTRTQQIVYRKDRFDRTAAGGFLVADGENEGGTIRFCTWVRLTDRETGRSFYHYNVHLDHRDLHSREQSVVRLLQHVAGRATDDPFVVTGDLNTAENSSPMAFLRGERTLPDDDGNAYANPIPLVDTYRMLHPDEKEARTAGGWKGRTKGTMIDHVLVAAGAATVHEAAIVHTNEDGRYPSDHFPVTAVVTWP